MSKLVYQNYNNKCKGWVNPSELFFAPEIFSLTGYQSPSGSNTVVSIIGTNFLSYSSVKFGTFTPTTYFINSNLLSFYVPNTLNPGTFPVQVCNGSICSNIVNYVLDNSSGYWLLNSNNSITNTNNNGVGISWLSRGLPITINNNSVSPYLIPNNVSWIICNNNIEDIYVSLPLGTQFIGREIMLKIINLSGFSVINSSGAYIQPIDSTSLTNIIISGSYIWVTLVYDGTSWITMQSG